MGPIDTTLAATDALARSRIYALLSSGFAYPTPEALAALRSGDLLEELEDLLASLARGADGARGGEASREAIRASLAGVSQLDLEAQFVRTFDAGDPEPACPPYEGLHRPGEERIPVLLEVSEFYRQFGLKMNGADGKREVADHLRAELEFMHFLAFKEVQAIEERDPEAEKGYVWAQKDFLERHLAVWVPRFAEKLAGACAPRVYVELARIAERFLAAEKDRAAARLEALGGARPAEPTAEPAARAPEGREGAPARANPPARLA